MIHKTRSLKRRQEIVAGVTTFLTMSYIIFVNPHVLSIAGMNYGAVFVTTCVITALGCFLIGWLADYPIALAPGMALNVYFTYIIVKGLGFHWQVALGAVFISGILFVIIALTKLRFYIIEAIPTGLNTAITVGLGLFIIVIAFRNIGINVATIGHEVLPPHIGLQLVFFLIGFITIILCSYFKIPGAVLFGILVATILGLIFGLSHYRGLMSLPPSIEPTLVHFQFTQLLTLRGISIIFSLLFVALFDCTGTLIGLLHEARLLDQPAAKKRIGRSLLANGVTTVCGAILGTSSTSPYLESATGIRAGGRSGLTALVIAGLFILALFFSPLAATVPGFATAPALLFVGCLMIGGGAEFRWRDVTEIIPAVITAFVIPITFSIANGVGGGIIAYTILKLCTGQREKINITLLVLSILFVIYFVLQGLVHFRVI